MLNQITELYYRIPGKVLLVIIIIEAWANIVFSCSEYQIENTIPFLFGAFPRNFPWPF
jgi:hypothetical protein